MYAIRSYYANLLVLSLQPEEGIFLRMGAKYPGPSICVQPVDFRFTYEQAFGVRSSPAYGRLLLDAMHGDATLFPREDTVEISWTLLEPFLRRWEEDPGRDLAFYPAGSLGPREADAIPGRVITSYSIHYTKLYDDLAGASHPRRHR